MQWTFAKVTWTPFCGITSLISLNVLWSIDLDFKKRQLITFFLLHSIYGNWITENFSFQPPLHFLLKLLGHVCATTFPQKSYIKVYQFSPFIVHTCLVHELFCEANPQKHVIFLWFCKKASPVWMVGWVGGCFEKNKFFFFFLSYGKLVTPWNRFFVLLHKCPLG